MGRQTEWPLKERAKTYKCLPSLPPSVVALPALSTPVIVDGGGGSVRGGKIPEILAMRAGTREGGGGGDDAREVEGKAVGDLFFAAAASFGLASVRVRLGMMGS